MVHEKVSYRSNALPGTACRRMVTLWRDYQWSYIPFLLVYLVVVFVDKPPTGRSRGTAFSSTFAWFCAWRCNWSVLGHCMCLLMLCCLSSEHEGDGWKRITTKLLSVSRSFERRERSRSQKLHSERAWLRSTNHSLFSSQRNTMKRESKRDSVFVITFSSKYNSSDPYCC